MGNYTSLRIKRIYLEAIARGEKTVEYRSCKPKYALLKEVKIICFHYQNKAHKIIVEVKAVNIIKCPEHIKNLGIEFTDQIYEVQLGDVYTKWGQQKGDLEK